MVVVDNIKAIEYMGGQVAAAMLCVYNDMPRNWLNDRVVMIIECL